MEVFVDFWIGEVEAAFDYINFISSGNLRTQW